MRILVTSPIPANFDRFPEWNTGVYNYDSGHRQGVTNWLQPLYRYGFSIQNFPISKQSSLHDFYNVHKGKTDPWLFQDPYDRTLTAVTQIASGQAIAVNSGFYLIRTNSYRCLPDSSALTVISALSGTLVSSTHYVASLDNGWIKLVLGKATADTISITGNFFRKVAFADFHENSFLWNQFNGAVSFEELLP